MKEREIRDVTADVDRIYEVIRERVIDKVTVRRTRSNIENDPEYKKDFGNEYSGWSNWETYTYDPNNVPQFGNFELVELKDLGRTRTLDYYSYTNSNPIYHTVKVNAGTLTKKYCKDYDYYVVSKTGKTYAVGQNVLRLVLSGVQDDYATGLD